MPRKNKSKIKIKGTAERPRLSVFRSNKMIYAQLIDDKKRKTLVSIHEREVSQKLKGKTKAQKAELVGEVMAKKAIKKKIKKIIFDRGFYRYHGRVKALAEGLRKGGLKF